MSPSISERIAQEMYDIIEATVHPTGRSRWNNLSRNTQLKWIEATRTLLDQGVIEIP